MTRQLIAFVLAVFLFAGPALATGRSRTSEIQAAATIATDVAGGVLVIANISRLENHTAAYIVVTTTNEVNTAVLTLIFRIVTPSGTFAIATPAATMTTETTQVYLLGSQQVAADGVNEAFDLPLGQGFEILQTVTGATASFDVEVSIVLLTTGGA